MRVHIGSDHAGLEIKARLIEWLRGKGHEPVDHGPFVFDPVDDYPVFCLRTGEGVVADPGSLGIVIGGSGNGEQIAANKVKGVRAALVWNDATAELARQHNDANIVSIGARQHTDEEMLHLIDVFLGTGFTGEERHVRRLGEISDFEATGELPPLPESAQDPARGRGTDA